MNELHGAEVTIKNAGHAEALALNGLLGFVNNPAVTGAEVPPGVETKVLIQPRVLQPESAPAAPLPASVPVDHSRVYFTGRLATGKDWIADQMNAEIFGFADPIYYLASYFFGIQVDRNTNKDLPGMRSWLQSIGQWGRAHVDAETPYTPARSIFIALIRSLAAHGALSKDYGIEWDKFGSDQMLWTNGVVRRAEAFSAANPGKRIASTNARFEPEFKALRDGGWTHYHVMCSPQTWAKRLAAKKLTPQSKELSNVSEHLAIHLDRDVAAKLKQPGNKLRVIWNDNEVAPPSIRLHTVASFLQEIAIAEAVPSSNFDVVVE
jgi:hypothetical protein